MVEYFTFRCDLNEWQVLNESKQTLSNLPNALHNSKFVFEASGGPFVQVPRETHWRKGNCKEGDTLQVKLIGKLLWCFKPSSHWKLVSYTCNYNMEIGHPEFSVPYMTQLFHWFIQINLTLSKIRLDISIPGLGFKGDKDERSMGGWGIDQGLPKIPGGLLKLK